jgi:hypothetical protein
MQDAAGQFAIRVHDLVVGFGRHVVIDHLALDVKAGRDSRPGRSVRRRQVGLDANHHRPHSAAGRGDRGDGLGDRRRL